MTHNVNVRMPPFLPTVPLPVVSSGMMYMYSCSQCDFKTHVEAMFKQHVDSVHLGLSNVNNVILSTNSVMVPNSGTLTVNPMTITSVAGQQHQTVVMTSQAPMVTAHKTGLTTTMMAATPTGAVTTVYKCPKCGFLAPSKNQLTQHKRKFHGKQAATIATSMVPATTFISQVQGGQVVSTNAVAVGPASGNVASGKKTYTCSTCGYSTTRRDGLSQHYDSVHLKIKNHQCSLCPYAASQKGTLNRHIKLRHKKKDEAP